jgi:hypothetical protein
MSGLRILPFLMATCSWMAGISIVMRGEPLVDLLKLGTVHHLAACFRDDRDRLAYLEWLHEASTRGRCRLHADVLITNPIHLLPTPEQAERAPRVPISVGRRDVYDARSGPTRKKDRKTSGVAHPESNPQKRGDHSHAYEGDPGGRARGPSDHPLGCRPGDGGRQGEAQQFLVA